MSAAIQLKAIYDIEPKNPHKDFLSQLLMSKDCPLRTPEVTVDLNDIPEDKVKQAESEIEYELNKILSFR